MTDTSHDNAAATSATETDLVIEEFDQWHNPDNTVAAFCAPTFNLVVVARQPA